MTFKTKLPEFQGKSLIEIPEFSYSANFLKGDFGKAFLEEYKGRVKSDYNNNPVLNVLNYKDGIVKGSNSYAVVLANQILKQEGLRTATQADLEKILKINALDLKGMDIDTGLVLRNEDGLEKYLVRDLSKQIKEKGYEFPKVPLVIWLNELNLENDKKSHTGLRFKLSENCKPFYVQILKKGGAFLSEDIDEETGLPKKLSRGGNRYLFVKHYGLSRFCFMSNSCLDSKENIFVDSYDEDSNRMVVVKE